MIKRFLVPIFLLFSIYSFAQSSASPYSLFGIGEARFKGTNEIRAMGGLTVFPDSIHINPQNPASFPYIKLTTFTIGGSYNAIKFKTNNASEKANRSTMDYLAFGIPMGKVGATFGINPFSSAGYNIKTIDYVNLVTRRYTADGGLNQAYLGFGYQVYKGLSVGANVNFNFGSINSESIIFKADSQFASWEVKRAELSGLSFNFGAMFNTKITSKIDLYSSVTYVPESNIDNNFNSILYSAIYTGDGIPIKVDSLETVRFNKKVLLPSKFSASIGAGQNKKWLLGAEATYAESSLLTNSLTNVSNATYENSLRMSFGGYYIPKYNSFSNYFQRITYRGGFRYENTGLVIKDIPIKDYAITGGMGMPISGSFSNVNIALEYGKRGTTNGGLIEENYFTFMVSLSFNDKWFRKREIQ